MTRDRSLFAFMIFGASVGGIMTPSAYADSDAELAQRLSNPISSLISVPFQYNFDHNIGPANDGTKNYINVQPVIPISLNQDWNMISRTIVPVVSQASQSYRRTKSFQVRAANSG